MTSLIDTHTHLDFPQFDKDLDRVLTNAKKAGVVAVINAGTDELSSRRSYDLSHSYPQVLASVGIHPHSADRVSTKWFDRLLHLAEDDNILAIGETGLDYYRNLSSKENQIRLFKEHIRLACLVSKPLIVHSRDAHVETLNILKTEKLPPKVGVMHCFSGDRDQAEAFLELGFYISIAGPVTYPRSNTLRNLLRIIPSDRLLLETDSPYLPPQAYRSQRNEPAYIRLIYERVAEVMNQELDQLARQVYVNAVRLFSDRLVDH